MSSQHLKSETKQEIINTAAALVADGKGILAADESFATIGKRFGSINVESSEDKRRDYREMLFSPDGLGRYISGVILFDETLRQKAADGTPIPDLLAKQGIVPGIKVDTGAKDLSAFPGEKITEGLGGLRERMQEYYALGARFAKWRAVITIDEKNELPTPYCMKANAHALARYASLCQEAGIVPIVEPEVLMDGSHGIDRCEAVTTDILKRVFAELTEHRVLLEGILLKPNMVIAAKGANRQAEVSEVAEATVRVLRNTVPPAVPGIVFLSGGQSPELATEHLNAMNAKANHPWKLSFSYGRALQEPALTAWKGEAANVPAAQKAVFKRAKLNSAACAGKYSADMEAAS